jgi:hypothetical protein
MPVLATTSSAHWEARSTYAWEADYELPFYQFSFVANSTSESTLTGEALGFFSGAALDYRLTRNIGLFVEGAYRHSKVSPLTGDLAWEESSQLTDWGTAHAPHSDFL